MHSAVNSQLQQDFQFIRFSGAAAFQIKPERCGTKAEKTMILKSGLKMLMEEIAVFSHKA